MTGNLGEIFQEKFWSPCGCPTSAFSVKGEMFDHLLSLLSAIVRHPCSGTRPRKSNEWQSEFLFVSEKRPFVPATPMTRGGVASRVGKSEHRTR